LIEETLEGMNCPLPAFGIVGESERQVSPEVGFLRMIFRKIQTKIL